MQQIKAKIGSLILLFILLATSQSSHAWEPCLPFCDMRCSGQAAFRMASQIASDVASYTSTCANLSTTLGETATAMVDMTTNTGEGVVRHNSDVLTAIDAATIKINLANDLVGASIASFSDLLTSTWHSALSNLSKVQELSSNNDLLGRSSTAPSPLLDRIECDNCGETLSSDIFKILANVPNRLLELRDYGVITLNDYISNTAGQRKAIDKLADFPVDMRNEQRMFQHAVLYGDSIKSNNAWERFSFMTQAESLEMKTTLELVPEQLQSVNALSVLKGATTMNMMVGQVIDEMINPDLDIETKLLNEKGLMHKEILAIQRTNVMLLNKLQQAFLRNKMLVNSLATSE